MDIVRRHRRSFCAAAALAYAIGAAGLPLAVPVLPSPLALLRGADQQRYPCEDCACGCATANHCWTRCCCHTLSERIAWARREGVRPPDAALAQATAAGLDVAPWRSTKKLPTPIAKSPTTRNRTTASGCGKCCCRSKTSPEARAASAPPARSQRPRGVVYWKALECQGLQQIWMACGTAPPPLPVSLDLKPASCARHETVKTLYTGPLFRPALPPPEPSLRG